MLRSIRNVKLLKCVSLMCLSPLFVFYSSLNHDGPRTKAFTTNQFLSHENGKQLQVTTIKITESKKTNPTKDLICLVQQLQGGGGGGAAAPPAPSPPLATTLNWCQNISDHIDHF